MVVVRSRCGSSRCRPVPGVLPGLVLSLVLATGCTGSTASVKADLGQALRDTRAAVVSATLALQLLDQHRTTRAATEVTVGDMADQVGLAQQTLADLPTDDAGVRSQRESTQRAVNEAMAALQATEDAVAASADTSGPAQRLNGAQQDLEALAREVGGR